MPVIIFIVVLACLIAYFTWRTQANAKKIAAARGWSYTKRDDSVLSRYATWPFYLGRAQKAESVIQGQFEGRNVTLFDFKFVNSPGGLQVNFGPFATTVGGQPTRSDTGIFTGYDPTLEIVTGRSRNSRMNRGSNEVLNWGICAMEMPGPLPQILVRLSFAADRLVETITEAVGAPRVPDEIITDISFDDPEFDKGFAVRAEDPKLAGVFLPKSSRDLLVSSRKQMVRHAVHIWTWDRYLFTLENMPLTEKMVTFRLPLMASIIANIGK